VIATPDDAVLVIDTTALIQRETPRDQEKIMRLAQSAARHQRYAADHREEQRNDDTIL